MQNNSTYKRLNFFSAMQQLHFIHDTEMNEDTFIELGSIAWRKIGNKETSFYKLTTKVTDGKIELPCNVYSIEAVAIADKDCCIDIPKTLFIDQSDKYPDLDIYISGKFIHYEWLNDYIHVDLNDDVEVNIIYVGLRLDDDGLPYINEKEAEAIAYYCAYIDTYKKVRRGVMSGDMMGFLKTEWERLCSDARVPETFSQNALDEILDVNVRWDRKRFNKSFKHV